MRYPNRPHNHSQTFFFSELYLSLFDPLSQNIKNPKAARTKSKISPHEQRRQIIDRFVSRWRSEVGNDIYPAFRLIMPDKDRDRPVYGLKEAVIARLLIKLLRIDPKSEDGLHMSQWKFVSGGNRNSSAGDFAGRCYDVLLKRNERTEPGNIRIAKVNHLLDRLAGAQGEREQLPIFEEFYANMNSVELKWLIRIILKQMKVGATEKTFFSVSAIVVAIEYLLNLLHSPGIRTRKPCSMFPPAFGGFAGS
jgi:DNA ligase-4